MRMRVWFLGFLLIATVPLSMFGQETELSVAQLKARLEKLQSELKLEQEALAEQRELHAAELEELKTKRTEVAESLLSAQVQREKNTGQLKSLREQEEKTAEESENLVEEAKALTAAIRNAAEQLRIHLREVPGSDDKMEELREAANLSWDPDDAAGNAELVENVFKAIDETHEDATVVSVKKVAIYTALGERERVRLLCLGHARFAYSTIKGKRVALALASPEDASGFRWSEDVDGRTQRLVRDAIAAVEARESGLVTVPIDPTGRIQPDTFDGEGLVSSLTAGGLVMLPLAALAVVAIVLIAERVKFFYYENPQADELASKVLAACKNNQFDQAQQSCTASKGAVSRVLAACLTRRTLGQRAMEDSIQEQLLHELPRLQRFMRGIATLAGVAPLLGLLGTVTGIIRTFGVIRAFGNANPSLMAGGISEALLTTAAGLVIAVPILIAHSLLRERSDKIIADCESQAARLLTTLAHDQTTDDDRHQTEDDEVPTHDTSNGDGQSGESDESHEKELAVD